MHLCMYTATERLQELQHGKNAGCLWWEGRVQHKHLDLSKNIGN